MHPSLLTTTATKYGLYFKIYISEYIKDSLCCFKKKIFEFIYFENLNISGNNMISVILAEVVISNMSIHL
jgi:hypothetical protein